MDGTVGSGSPSGRTRILIVEDDPVSALLLTKVLATKGYPVDHAEHGVEGLKLFKERRHRIVISDWMMPELDGVSLCREFRNLGDPYVYVMLLSAKGQREERLEAYEAGVDDFLTKPLDRDELFARLMVAERFLAAEEGIQAQKEEVARSAEKLRLANSNLMVASRRFQELFSGMPMACFTFDRQGLIHEWNRAAEHLFSLRAHEVLLTQVWETLRSSASDIWSPEFIDSVFEGLSVEGREWLFKDRKTDERHLLCNVFPLRSPDGEVLGAISANLEITERKQAEQKIEQQKSALEEANERLERLAVTDGLSGLWNHRRFHEELEMLYSQHMRSSRPLSLVFLDVDHFKQYNDTFGHLEGDVVLKSVASTLLGSSRTHEAVARYGGEEFAILLPDTTAEQAMLAAERFRDAINSIVWPLRAVTASFGVATLGERDLGPKELIFRADTALYASKQGGRNRVTHWNKIAPSEARVHRTEAA